MQDAHVDDLDLRSLRFLAALLETVSITRTGEIFGLSQPAASRVVERLRRALADPLLVRGSRGYVLTKRAEALKPFVANVRVSIDAVFAPDEFDPQTASRTFRIGSTDYGALTVLADLSRTMMQVAPATRLEIAPWAEDTLKRLEEGSLDAALYPEAPLPQDFHFKPLFRDDYALALDNAFAPIDGLKLEEIWLRRRIVVLYPDGRRLMPDDVLGDLGAPADLIALRTPYFTSATWALPGTSMIMALPSRVAKRLAQAARLLTVPLATLVPDFSYRLVWHARVHNDPSHRWLRALIKPE